ncbi:vWA domain-containing protein [Rhizobacter sp. SG703]|uniref:vWA domain-containing protein n=1 Tax=Rhizobacter sp. SG703 TaxID=2587140 RepID=UPI00144533BA|nr:vWA domain-containing protein [Rhizobacter sp. SG703]NKI94460.1 Mg-chelatase subunit ChlD [Rhizobacter sp. SG703]
MDTMKTPRRTLTSVLIASLLLAACAGSLDGNVAQAAEPWPPVWQDAALPLDDAPPAFTPPSATSCHRLPAMREVPGGAGQSGNRHLGRAERLERDAMKSDSRAEAKAAPERRDAPAMAAGSVADALRERAPAAVAPAARPSGDASTSFAPEPWPAPPAPQPTMPRPARETVTAGMVDDNADFGEYLAYRQRNAGLPVRERDISERYLLEVTDAQGDPVHDAEVAVQRAGVAQPLMWARTDTAGRVWLHPRAFLPRDGQGGQGDRVLGIAVRKNGVLGRAQLQRGQASAVQVRLGQPVAAQRPRLDLVFMVDATGSMGDEIAKLKHSMHAMAQQIAQLPLQPDVCWGLVAYRDRGDAFLTRTQDFTDDLRGFQQVLGQLQADGGGDTPEALNEALHEVVHGLSWRRDAARMVVLVADAPPHLDYGGPQYDTDMQAALAKGIKLFAVGASGLDPVGEYIYRQIAQYTAGRFVFLTYRDGADPASGPGTQTTHDVKQYSVQTLDRLVVKLVGDELAKLKRT